MRDLVIVGGGPAGLAAAIAAATQGLDVVVLERRALPADKACGEGILPGGVRALEQLGVLEHLASGAAAPLSAIRWIDDSDVAEARLPAPGGLGVRRTALSAALVARARSVGVEIRTGVAVVAHERSAERVRVVLASTSSSGRGPPDRAPDEGGSFDAGPPSQHERGFGDGGPPERARSEPGSEAIEGRLLVAADGLRSPIAARERLGRTLARPARFGVRRHFHRRPWSSSVEVHLGDGAEAYVTPVGPDLVGVAMLCERDGLAPFESLLDRFPALGEHVAGAPVASTIRGAGPFPSAVRARVLDRLVLVGDAGGYEDAITGDGLSLAFESAVALGEALPRALAAGASRSEFAAWERSVAARYWRYLVATRSVLALVRRPAVRRFAIRLLGRRRAALEGLVGLSLR